MTTLPYHDHEWLFREMMDRWEEGLIYLTDEEITRNDQPHTVASLKAEMRQVLGPLSGIWG